MSTEPIIRCTGIRKTFLQAAIPSWHLQDHMLRFPLHRRRTRIAALCDVSLSLAAGEWVGITGPNGGGKTTLLKVLAGLLPAEQGTVEHGGKVVCFFGLGIGFHPERNAYENIYHHCLLYGMTPREIRERTERILQFADVWSHVDLPLKCYSLGMQLRLAFAAAASMEADAYLLDEVFAVGDAAFREKCKERFLELKRAGKAILIVAQNVQGLYEWCDRVYEMREGKLSKLETQEFASQERASLVVY